MDYSKYDGLKGAEFLITFFRDNGITDEEVDLYSSWDGFSGCYNVCNNQDGISYAMRRVECIKRYRSVTLNDLRENYEDAPWAWPSAMRFYYTKLNVSHNIKGGAGVLMCIYNDETYFFNVGK